MMDRETWLNDAIDRRYIVSRILPPGRALRQSPPHGFFWHLLVVAFSHARAGAASADIDRTITHRAGPIPAEQLSSAAVDDAVVRIRRGWRPAQA
jgi:hypothetical protein